MRRVDGRFECVLCGSVLDVRADATPLVTLVARSGEPNMRVISVDGVEVHACRADLQRRDLGTAPRLARLHDEPSTDIG
jgi:hypothetical protein